MTVFKRGRIYHYDFEYRGERYWGSTRQTDRQAAEIVEADLKKHLRLKGAGLVAITAADTPRFSDFAEILLTEKAKILDDVYSLQRVMRIVLAFWGGKPATGAIPDAPYYDLRMGDVIEHPELILKFEAWMSQRGIAASTRNHYRSALSTMYRVAAKPQYRGLTHILSNPFLGDRDATEGREVTISLDQLRAWLACASYHCRLAVAIAALAPKLRLASILALEWHVNFDPELRWITVRQHKTARRTKRPQVSPISAQLRRILLDAKARTRSGFVVEYMGRPVKSINEGVKAAVIEAGLPYGIKVPGGVTFHVLRHTAATLMAELDITEKKRQELMGHSDIQTTQKYTHLRPVHLVEPVEQLSVAVPIEDLVTARRKRAARMHRPAVGEIVGTASGGSR
jgi:integrase